MRIEIKGLETNYIDCGTGPVLLFLHGWGAEIGLYAPVLDFLAKRYRVLAFDMPGVGGTAEPSKPYTLSDYTAFTLEFIRKLELDDISLLCHSHGGRIACALLGGEGKGLRFGRAVFMDAAGIPPKRSAGYRLRLAAYKALGALGRNKLTAPIFGDLYRQQREKRSSADYRAASDVMKKTLSNVVESDLRPLMPNIMTPVLLIWGEKDTATPLSDGQEMERLIQGSGLAVIKNAGHFPFIDNPTQFYAVLGVYMTGKEGGNA